jgi:hypothetical protein
MLTETREELTRIATEYLEVNNISTYRARKDKITFNGVCYNSLYTAIKDGAKIHNNTLIKLLCFFDIEFDEQYYDENNIIRIL